MPTARTRSLVSFATLFGAAALLTACPGGMTQEDKDYFAEVMGEGGGTGGGGNGSGGAAASCDAPSVVFQTSCVGTGCHGSTNSAAALDLTVSDPFTAYKDKAGSAESVCGEHQVIDSANPEQSLLYSKMFPADHEKFAGCGIPMPFGPATPEQATQAACVLSWIQGKLGNSSGSGGGTGSGGGGGGDGTGGSDGAAGSNGTGGGDGSGGSTNTGSCDDGDTEVSNSGWSAEASRSAADAPASNAIDSDPGSRWGTGDTQQSGDEFTLSFGDSVSLDKVVFHCASAEYFDPPLGTFVFEVSQDGTTFTEPDYTSAKDEGAGTLTVELNACQSAQAVRLRLTQDAPEGSYTWLSIYDIEVFR